MKEQSQLGGLLQPFNNTDTDEREKNFEMPSTKDTTVVLFFLTQFERLSDGMESRNEWDSAEIWGDHTLDDFEAALHELVKECLAKSPFAGLDYEIVVCEPYGEEFVNMDWLPMSELQEDWAIDGIHHLQVGFFDRELFNPCPDPKPAVYVGMTVYDQTYAETGVLEPMDQTPMAVDQLVEKLFRLFLGDIFKERVAVFCRELVGLRNELMVKAHAKLYGADPEQEWKRFCDAGFAHYLDYLKIWQPPQQ